MKKILLLIGLLIMTAWFAGCQCCGTACDRVGPDDSVLEVVYDQGVFTEGPAVDGEGAVLFTDLRRNLILRFDPRTGITKTYREDSGSANGLVFDQQGNLLACEGADGGGRRISITGTDGVLRTLVDHYEGKKFNSPNDIVVAANGDVYFTDPRYRGAEPVELDFEGVFLVRTGKAILATRDTERPNGIVISSNGKTAYVADNNNREGGARTLLKFNVNADGTFSHKKVLHRFSETQRGIDGMTLGPGGDVYATAGKGQDAGVYVFSPSGKVRDVIRVPDVPTNCIFGGADEPKVLYITAQTGHTLPDGGPACGLLRIKLP